MKKTLTFITAVLLCLVLVSCSDGSGEVWHTIHSGDGTKAPETVIIYVPGDTVIVTVPVEVTEAPETSSPETQEVTTVPLTTEEVTTESPIASSSSYTYQRVEEKLGEGSVATYIFPVLENTGNSTLESKVNKLLAGFCATDFKTNEICKDYAQLISNGKKVSYTVNKCEIKLCTGRMLSLRYEAGYTTSDRSDSYSFVYTHIINMSTGKEVKKSALFSDFASVLTLLENGKFTKGETSTGFDTDFSLQSSIQYYRNGLLYNLRPDCYLTEDSLYIVFAGDSRTSWGEYYISLDSVRNYLALLP